MSLARFAVSLALAACASSPVMALPCSGFSDVDSLDPACPNVTWLKNRGVTTGCAAGLYCPAGAVTRLQMAVFMNRFASALEPDFLYQNDLNAEAEVNAEGVACESPPYTVVDFARLAVPAGTMLYHGGPDASSIVAALVYRTPPSTLWLAWGPISRVTSAGGSYAFQAPIAPPLNLQVGETYAFGIRATRGTGTPPSVAVAQCALLVRIDNRN